MIKFLVVLLAGGKIFIAALSLIFFAGCQRCYNNNYLTFTNYDTDDYKELKTDYNITVYSNQEVDLNEIDRQTKELETCLEINIKKSCFAVLIPDDWFYSTISEQQLLPYAAPIELCWSKGLQIPEECSGVAIPTQACPLTCNWRVATQDNFLIVTPPSLLLYKAELARLVLGVNNVWADPSIAVCL